MIMVAVAAKTIRAKDRDKMIDTSIFFFRFEQSTTTNVTACIHLAS
jgi:hypothetical protein